MSGPHDPLRRSDALRWIGDAQGDLASAVHQAAAEDLPARVACFLAHLAVEKAIKALLVDAGIPFAKVHNLLELHGDLPEPERALIDPARLAALNPWAVAGRYTADLVEADHDVALRLITEASAVVQVAVEHFDLPAGLPHAGEP
ncbi:MAG: HEPN domain-containing protein [Actinobacteria bacterium]|jgi:HEPN domain-containing protein|nr:HEPN domain-containing protein [Actinomycetota bacterium]MDA8184755.1 HEPN domain-containing protein [Actinomycetota bacterium]